MSTSTASINHSYIIRISFVSALGGFLFGFDFAVISGALPFLKPYFSLTAVMEGFLTGSLALGCMAGCLAAGRLADHYGRKKGLMVAALVFALSSLGMALAPTLTALLIARWCAGLGVGMASMLSPLYIAEISPAESRGRNVAINQLTIVMGILVTNIVNYLLAGKGEEAWRWMFSMGCIPAMLFFLGTIVLPESPRWLVRKGRMAEAQVILNRMHYGQTAMDLMDNDKNDTTRNAAASFRMLFTRRHRSVLLTGVVLAVFQQLCGINIVFNYTSTIFSSVGADTNNQLLQTIAIGAVNLLFTLAAMRVVDRWGRRPLMLFGALGLAILYIALAMALQQRWANGLTSSFVLLAIACYATSLAPVTWVLIAEIFPNRIRSMASSFAILSLWAAYFILVFTFPWLAERLGTYGPFYFYAVICLLGFLFIRSRVKETKGRSLEEMEKLM